MNKSNKKIIKNLLIKEAKNPGKENKEKRKERNKAKRGQLIPAPKIVPSKKEKNKKRSSLKRELHKNLKNYD